MKRIALMGGTFDPIHYGHLVAAEAARVEFCLDKVIFVPAGAPPHKTYRKVSDGVDRYLMTVMATITNPNFEVSSYEIDKIGPSYAIDTVKYFKEIFPDAELYFITGADAILEIYTWKQSKELLGICNFIAATRPGYNITDIENVLGDDLEKVNFIEIPALAISSSDIRKRVREKRPITYLLPDSTANFVYKQALYLE